MWLLTTLRVVPMWVIDFAHAEESWALWLLAALSVVGALVPIYRTHGQLSHRQQNMHFSAPLMNEYRNGC